MASEGAAMLFCPPQPPLRLASDRPAVVGRHRSCDLPVRRSNVSRRHAEVLWRDGRYRVRDLGSTNGTFVNGEQIDGERVLEPGDRIEVGSCPVLFCQIQGDVEALGPGRGDEQTVFFERPRPEALHGDLAEIPPFALLQLLEMGAKSGRLEVESPEGRGVVQWSEGHPVHAETAKAEGLEAALEIVAWERGRFRFEPGEPGERRTLEASVTELLLEASRLRDEAEAGGV